MNAGVSVDLRSATPPYEQIRSQISSLIATGDLAVGSRLPTVRSLAADLGIAAGTVNRAYKELEAAGLIESRRRNGTVVAQPSPGRSGQAGVPLPDAVTAAVDLLVNAGRDARLSDELLLDLVRGKLRKG
ncbi:GntR family transcriptional regulator [Pseudarthrobacter sulfonivorans]|uniref:GntR family transcriptional regulator n=1 Tax=Pseudarthrobacter sulfonivorans TaxID=121292 RepID=UPI00285D71FB|nr:GntR family transcriptional regulator [Pseudarthrobacter sulfonivorans]MDR6413535.1 DNA-binding transcriptional regulator YhcF (GntR family) [Pseudarthrobacter sulfonivorans]